MHGLDLLIYIYLCFHVFLLFHVSSLILIYVCIQLTYPGASVEAAGLFVAAEGRLVRLFPHSGHYRPAECHLRCLLQFLHDHQVDRVGSSSSS